MGSIGTTIQKLTCEETATAGRPKSAKEFPVMYRV